MAYCAAECACTKLYNVRLSNELDHHSSNIVDWNRVWLNGGYINIAWYDGRPYISRTMRIPQLCFPDQRANLHFRRLDVSHVIRLILFFQLFNICDNRLNSIRVRRLVKPRLILDDRLGRHFRQLFHDGQYRYRGSFLRFCQRLVLVGWAIAIV